MLDFCVTYSIVIFVLHCFCIYIYCSFLPELVEFWSLSFFVDFCFLCFSIPGTENPIVMNVLVKIHLHNPKEAAALTD